MDDLTGANGLHSSASNQPASQNQDVMGANPHLGLPRDREPIFRVDLINSTELEVKRKHRVALDASRKDRGLLAQFHQSPAGHWLKAVRSKISGERSIEIARVIHRCQRDKLNFVDGWISALKPGDQIVGSNMTIQGWLVGARNVVTAVQVISDTRLILESPVNLPRPDVLKVIPFNSSFCNYGFQFILNVEAIPSMSEVKINAIIEGDSIPAGSIYFYKYGF
jgi:hypothetical protein